MKRYLAGTAVELLEHVRACAQRERERRADVHCAQRDRLFDEELACRGRRRRFPHDRLEDTQALAVQVDSHLATRGVDDDMPSGDSAQRRVLEDPPFMS